MVRKRSASLIGHRIGSYAEGRKDALAGRDPRLPNSHVRGGNPWYFQGFTDAQLEMAAPRRLAQMELELDP